MDTASSLVQNQASLLSKIVDQLGKQLVSDPLFFILASIILITALAVIMQKNLVRAGFTLIACFGALALAYFALGAELVAVSQVLIYAVGISLVVIFAIMLLSGTLDDAEEQGENKVNALSKITNRAVAFTITTFTFILMSYSFIGLSPAWSALPPFPKPRLERLVDLVSYGREKVFMTPTIERIGQILLSEQLLAFELVSILLLIAFVSAIVLSKREV